MDQEQLNMHIQESFQRLGVPLQGRKVSGLSGVNPGYTLRHLTNTHFKNGAEAVLQEPDPQAKDCLRVFAVFPQTKPAMK